jgi:hypothetical protein
MKRSNLIGSIMLTGICLLFFNSSVSAQNNNLRADLESFQEVPSVSSPASGQFRAKIIKNSSIEYTLTYKGLEADATQSHIHFGQPGVNGGIVVFLCQTATNADPTNLAPQCPLREGTVTGTISQANVIDRAAGQGIDWSNTGTSAPEFAELLRAIREDVTYANVHTTKFGSGEIRGQIK